MHSILREVGGFKKPSFQPQGPMQWTAQSIPGGLGFGQSFDIKSEFSVNLLIEGFNDQLNLSSKIG
jgi:hypothetical protein